MTITVATGLVLTVLLSLCIGGVWSGPLLFSSLLSGASATGVENGTSVLSALALAHIQHKVDALAQLAELFASGANATESLFLNK